MVKLTDITERLRRPLNQDAVKGSVEPMNRERIEAADEIERLRDEVSYWKHKAA